jgi:hypothetical protein
LSDVYVNKDKKRDALIYISFIDMLFVAIFIILLYQTYKLVVPAKKWTIITKGALPEIENEDPSDREKRRKIFEDELFNNIKNIKPKNLYTLSQLGKEEITKLDTYIQGVGGGGRSYLPYEDESKPIARLVYRPTGSDEIGGFMWTDIEPKFEQWLINNGISPEDVKDQYFSYQDLKRYFLDKLVEERDQLKKRENKLRLHKIYFNYRYSDYLPIRLSGPEVDRIRSIKDAQFFVTSTYKN